MRHTMDQTWQEVKLQLDSLHVECTAISAELVITSDYEQAGRLRARAFACIDMYLAVLRQYSIKCAVRASVLAP